MRETNFIKQNKEKWRRFERMLKFKQNDPQKLSKLFIQITDDLSYARTFYPNRSVRVYLNNLAQQIFYSIYKSKKTKRGGLFKFWTDELPQLMYHARRELLLSFLIFMAAMLIGAFSTLMDPEFPRVILGDNYVETTISNIQNGDPMAVYKQRNEIDMSFSITYNNLRVGFLSFISGLFAGLGTIGVLIYNGIMVGAFQYFFYEQGQLRESFLTIWIHGTLEISTIILAGCAGLTLGKGLVFPGTYSRLQSLQRYGLRALKIMIGIIPIIIAAGFIEGFVTRYTDAPDILRLGIILASLSFILLYFVWYPRQKAKEGFKKPVKDTRIPPSRPLNINYKEIKTSANIFTETFRLYSQYFSKIFSAAFLLACAYTLILLFKYQLNIGEVIASYRGHSFEDWLFNQHFANLFQFFNYEKVPILGVINTVVFGTMVYMGCYYFIRNSEKHIRLSTGFHIIGWLGAVGIWGMFNAMIWQRIEVAVLGMLLFPLLLLWLVVMLKESKNPFSAIVRTLSLWSSNFSSVYGVFLIMLLISFLFSYIFSSPILWFLMDIIGWNFSLPEAEMSAIFAGILTFIFSMFFCLIFPVFMISTGLLYASLKEVRDADGLREKIEMIGVKKQAFGLDQER